MTTRSRPCAGDASAIAARRRRFARLRTTAPPTRLPATTARRAGPASSRCRTWTTAAAPPADAFARTTARMSAEEVSFDTPVVLSSRGQALAALVAAGLDDGPAGLGAHARGEAVLALAGRSGECRG